MPPPCLPRTLTAAVSPMRCSAADQPVVLTPSGRNAMTALAHLAEALASKFQVLLWDRANIGASDVQFRGARDLDLWSDQLAALLCRLDLAPAYLCAPSAGSRVSYTTALRYPEVVRGMYLWLVSGGSGRTTAGLELLWSVCGAGRTGRPAGGRGGALLGRAHCQQSSQQGTVAGAGCSASSLPSCAAGKAAFV